MTRHLPVMGREGRVIVLKFGYSNLKTLPTVNFCFSVLHLVSRPVLSAGGSRPSEAHEPPSSETYERVPGEAAPGQEEGALQTAALPRGQARH